MAEILDERAFVNGIVGLMATGGSTNQVIHLPAMARAAGVILDIEDFADLSGVVPLMAKVYPNGLADVNHFHAAGGLAYLIGELLAARLLHDDTRTVAGDGLARYASEPRLSEGRLVWAEGPRESHNDKIVRPAGDPFQPTGGLKELSGNLGRAVMEVSAVKPEHRVVEAPVRIFHDQEAVKVAFRAGEFTRDTVVVVRFQGLAANGMPELHSLTPVLAVLLDRGLKVALVTDGRMSGASGKFRRRSTSHLKPQRAVRSRGCATAMSCGSMPKQAISRRWSIWTPARRSRRTYQPTASAPGANCSNFARRPASSATAPAWWSEMIGRAATAGGSCTSTKSGGPV